MMQFLVFLFFSVLCSCLCMYKICRVTKLKVSHKKDLFYLKEKADQDRAKTAHSNTPPHVYFTMWKYFHNAAQMFTQRKKLCISVDAAMSGRRCVFQCESKITLFGLPKVDAIRNHWLRFVYNRTAQPKCLNLCNAFYG